MPSVGGQPSPRLPRKWHVDWKSSRGQNAVRSRPRTLSLDNLRVAPWLLPAHLPAASPGTSGFSTSHLGWECRGQGPRGHWVTPTSLSTHCRLPGFGRSWRPRRSRCPRGVRPGVPGGPRTGWAPRHAAPPPQMRAASGTLFWAPWQPWWPSCSTCSILWCPRVAGDELASGSCCEPHTCLLTRHACLWGTSVGSGLSVCVGRERDLWSLQGQGKRGWVSIQLSSILLL